MNMSPKNKIALFLTLTLVLSSLAYIPVIRSGSLGSFSILLMWAPGVSAILTQVITTSSLKGLGWRPGKARWLGLAYGLPLFYALPVYGLVWLTGLGRIPNPALIDQLNQMYPVSHPWTAITIYVVIAATLGFLTSLLSATGEEIGWRGLLVPELAKITTFTKTALISGVIWAAWHMPAVILADYNSAAPLWYAIICFVILVMAISFPFAWLSIKSGSFWPAAILHASHNLFIQGVFDLLTQSTGPTPFIIGEFGIGMVLTGLVAAFVFWRMRHDLPPQEPVRTSTAEAIMPAV
jgi:uncharacterized protein